MDGKKMENEEEWLVKFAHLAGLSEIEFINAPNGGWFGSDGEGNSVNVTWAEVFKRLEEDSGIRQFQEEVRDRVIDLSGAPDHAIDGGGSDGDWIEFTFAEIGQGFAWLRDKQEELAKQIELIRQSVSMGSDGRLELEDEEKFAKAITAALGLTGKRETNNNQRGAPTSKSDDVEVVPTRKGN